MSTKKPNLVISEGRKKLQAIGAKIKSEITVFEAPVSLDRTMAREGYRYDFLQIIRDVISLEDSDSGSIDLEIAELTVQALQVDLSGWKRLDK